MEQAVTRRAGLGRGLDALLPAQEARPEGTGAGLNEVPLDAIVPNPRQPRHSFDDDAIGDLAESIRALGILQPLLVRELGGGRYELVAGERRVRASRLAGLERVPVMTVETDDRGSLERALVENLHREDLNPIEEANAIHTLMEQGGLTQQDAAKRLGKSRPAVANVLRLLSLPAVVQDSVSRGSLSEGHARVLAGLKSAAQQESLARRVVLEGLSVRTLEKLCQAPQEAKPSPAPRLAPELRDFAERLQQATGLRAKIQGDLEQGTITLRYTSAQELQGLYEALEQILP